MTDEMIFRGPRSRSKIQARAMKIFLDLDDTLVSLQLRILKLFGVSSSELSRITDYDRALYEVCGVGPESLWKIIDEKGPEFWSELPWTPWGEELLALSIELVGRDNVFVATCPRPEPNCAKGKTIWCERHVGRRYIITPHKELLAGPDRILVDDRPFHLDNWREAGGAAAVATPQPWNVYRDMGKSALLGALELAVKLGAS